jgi:hypothetical protein
LVVVVAVDDDDDDDDDEEGEVELEELAAGELVCFVLTGESANESRPESVAVEFVS